MIEVNPHHFTRQHVRSYLFLVQCLLAFFSGPLDLFSCGSSFKPAPRSSSWLCENRCGSRGMREGLRGELIWTRMSNPPTIRYTEGPTLQCRSIVTVTSTTTKRPSNLNTSTGLATVTGSSESCDGRSVISPLPSLPHPAQLKYMNYSLLVCNRPGSTPSSIVEMR